MRLNRKLIVVLTLLLPVSVMAQKTGNDDELNAEIAVVKPYNPSISDAFKINKQPAGADSTSDKLNVDYGITTSPLQISFVLSPIKAPTIKRTPVDKLYKNNVRLGLGNSSTFLGEVMLNSERSRNGAYGVHLYHLSSKANVPNIEDSGYSTNGLSLYGKKFFARYALGGNLSLGRDVVRYFGSGPEFANATIEKQQLMSFQGSTSLQANKAKDQVFFDKAEVTYAYLKDDFKMSEQRVKGLFEVSKNSKDGLVLGQLESNFLQTNQDGASQQFFTGELGMKVDAHKEKFNYSFGVKAALIMDLSASQTSTFFYPDINVSYNLLQDYIIAYAGVNGGLQESGMKVLASENPFLNTMDSVEYTNEQISILGGLKGRISTGSSYHLGAKYSKVQNHAFFALPNAVTPVDSTTRKFNVIYDDVNRFQFFAELGIDLSKKLFVNGRMDVIAYTMDNLLKAYYQPNFKTNLMARYNVQEKIYFNTEWYYVGARYFNATTKLDGFIDGNLGLEYRYSNNLTAFINANNLLGNNYNLWEGYQSQAFNVLGGFTYKF
jgi:hypothetical protein